MHLLHFSELCVAGWSDFSNSSKELIKAKTALTCSSFIFFQLGKRLLMNFRQRLSLLTCFNLGSVPLRTHSALYPYFSSIKTAREEAMA